MRASLIQVNLVIVTADVDDNTWLVRFLHGIHLLVIIGPQNWGDFPSANNKEILQPYILIRTSTNPTSQTVCSARSNTKSLDTVTTKHTYILTTSAVTVLPCSCVTVWGWRGADGTSAGEKCIPTHRYDAARVLITSQTKSDLTARTDDVIISQ